MEVKDYMKLHYPIIIETIDDDGETLYKASIKELPGLVVYVDSTDEVFPEIESAKEIWFETNLEFGRSITLPKESDSYAYSGKLTLRIPKSKHRSLVVKAEEENMSLNSYINYLISEGEKNYSLSRMVDNVNNHIDRRFTLFTGKVKQLINNKNMTQYHVYLPSDKDDTSIYRTNTESFV